MEVSRKPILHKKTSWFLRKNVRTNQSMKQEKTIISFWEPKGGMTPYLELCRKTWERNLPDYEIVFLDYSNIGRYMPEGTYDMKILRKFTLMMQKDAIMIAVLKEHGGVFMDADTLVKGDITPLVRMLRDTEVVMFSNHLAFMAARPGSHLLTLWHKTIQEKINFMRDARDDAPQFQQWDFIGNSTLAEVMDKMIENLGLFHMMQKNITGKIFLAYSKITNDQKFLTPRLKVLMNRIGKSLMYRKRALYFRKILRRYLIMLNPREYGFIPEVLYFTSKVMTNEEKYWKFWFDDSIDIKEVFRPNQIVIGLHNSWTPEWYKELSEKDVLENKSLLSRTLKCLLT
jgi:mannosyltransferase OCH1-like enzyme